MLQCRHLQRRASGFIRLKLHPLKARLDARKHEEDPAGEENGKKKRRRALSVNGEEDGTGRRPHFQTARITPFSERR
jgi:hypothetical protein